MSDNTNKHGAHVAPTTPPERWSHRRAEELNEAVHVALSVHAPALSQRKRDAVNSHARQQLIDSHTSWNALTDPAQSFQGDVATWMCQCFPPSLSSNMTERGDRLLEEVLELLQAHGYDSARVPTLVNYVFGRPVGEPAQEIGGVMVTLAAYCNVAGLSMQADGQAELDRINQPEVMGKIRAKQEAKNALHFDTPLPGDSAAPPAQAVDLAEEMLRRLVAQGYIGTDGGMYRALRALIDSKASAPELCKCHPETCCCDESRRRFP